MGIESLCRCLYKEHYISKNSELLIKHIATVIDIYKSNSKQLLLTLKSLSLVAKREYVNKVFDRNISKLISLQEKGKLLEEESTNMKNL